MCDVIEHLVSEEKETQAQHNIIMKMSKLSLVTFD